jgi:hypothetical protein
MSEVLAVAVAGLLLVAVPAATIGGIVGYRLGVKRAAARIANFFTQAIPSADNELKSVPELLGRRTLTDESLWRLADILHFAAFNDGAVTESRTREPKPQESTVEMRTADLETVAWLADTGLRAWIAPTDNPFRRGEQLPYEKAEKFANVLDTFERRVAPSLLREGEEERERRMAASENRMHRIWRAYGKL